MSKIKNLTLSLALVGGCAASYAQSSLTPDILFPQFAEGMVIKGLSDNGKYGVGDVNVGESGSYYADGAVIYDLTGTSAVPMSLSDGKGSQYHASDVTDDGKMVVGCYENKPAICINNGGKWTWKTLEVPRDIVTIKDYTQDPVSERRIMSDGGTLNAVTPDGKYAVGFITSTGYYIYEKAVLYDLTDLDNIKIVDIPNVPQNGRPNPSSHRVDENHQTRFVQISADGNYILGWTSISFGGEDVLYVIDRKNDNEIIYVNYIKGEAEDDFTPRLPGYDDIELDFFTKTLTSDGHYVAGWINELETGSVLPFRFDVWNKELKVLSDGFNTDVAAWSVTKNGLVLGATPATTPYADGLICTDDFFFTFESLYRDVYGMNMRGIDNTGKPFLVSDDGRTVVMITEPRVSYVVRFKEDIEDAIDRINLLSRWSVAPASGSKMSALQSVTFTFDNPIEVDASKYAEVKLLDGEGNLVANPLANGGLSADGRRLKVTFRTRQLNTDEKYSLVLPAGLVWVKGRPNNTNNEISVSYVGRANTPVVPTAISPASGSSVANLDLNENPVVVTFDTPVIINGTVDNRPYAYLYVDEAEEAYAPLNLDVDMTTGRLVIFPTNTVSLYQGSVYTIKVPAGAVTDYSGNGPNEAFEITYKGSFVPQLGDDMYVFKSTGDDFTNVLVYEGDHGTPTDEYINMGFENADQYPWWVVADNEQSTDMAFASHSCYTDGRKANDWLTTRQLKLPSDVSTYLSFQGQSYRKNKTDILKIYVYENNASLNQLTAVNVAAIREKGDLIFNEQLDPGPTEGGIDGEWTDYTVDLSPYMGKNIYICFLNENQNQSMVMIDNIYVVKNLSAFVSLTSPTSVVAQDEAEVKGILSVVSDLADYSSINMTLLDADGNKVSEISESGLSLGRGDMFNFAFPEKLPVEIGVENPFSIVFSLDDDSQTYEGVIRDLAFEPVKRVIIEEYTGKDCQFCPLGLAAMERLESMFPAIIPVALHVYNGTDPKGVNMIDYASAVFQGSTAAPSARINRRPGVFQPMYQSQTDGKYHMTAADVPGAENVWQDEVVAELNEPTFLDIALKPLETSAGQLGYEAVVKSALNLSNQNVRVLGFLLEDGMEDRQKSGVFNISDPLLGEFGAGGAHGTANFKYTFNNVAKAYWGQSVNGTPNLLPSDFEAGKEYTFSLTQRISGLVDKAENAKMAVVLIDGNTGRVINAAVSLADITGVDNVVADGSAIEIAKVGSSIVVAAPEEVTVGVFSLDGRQIAAASGEGTVSLALEGYSGVAIVRAVTASSQASVKILF